ncbi:MAG: rRNA maturation RNase YbeY [Actinomycetota bacterium]
MNDESDSPTVVLSNRQDLPIDEDGLVDLARRTLAAEGHGSVELSVSLVSRDEMADLHRRYASERGPTDVLSFPQDEAPQDGHRRLLGDVVICPAVAAEQGSDPRAELRLLLVHGILHLLGYDHQEEEDRRAMWERQERYSGVRA